MTPMVALSVRKKKLKNLNITAWFEKKIVTL